MRKRGASAVMLVILGAVLALAGCAKSKPVEHDKPFTALYAELMLLQEQEKMTLHVSDSLYQVRARGILTSYGMSEDAFRRKSAELAKNDEAWQAFLADVSLVYDSLKTARQQPLK